MRFKVDVQNDDTLAVQEFDITLDAEQCKEIESIRARDGEDQALLIAGAHVLTQVYQKVDPRKHSHLAPPARVYLS